MAGICKGSYNKNVLEATHSVHVCVWVWGGVGEVVQGELSQKPRFRHFKPALTKYSIHWQPY